MANQYQVVTCQQCGIGFMVTRNYRAFLERWDAQVIEPVQCLSCFLSAGPMPKQEGQVKWFNTRRKYGFIVSKNDQDVFFHQDQILRSHGAKPREGQSARFHVRYALKGPEALNVELVHE
jgi:cold shock CspA family protein